MSTLPHERIGDPPSTTVGLVDVVIPCFNDGVFLLEALRSLGLERAEGKGVIIVNDGSTDPATLDVLAGLRMRGFHVLDQENKGLSAARNAGYRACSAPYVLYWEKPSLCWSWMIR
jgi:glycosyltransferase involved in cell wall biosynthesis